MKILLDATPIPKQPVGAGIYIKNLVKGVLTSNSDFHFRVLAHEDDFGVFELDESFRDQFIFCKDFGRGARILSEQIRYPSVIRKEKIDLFHGLHYSFPLSIHCPKMVTVHDLTYFTNPERHLFLKRYYFQFFIKQACKKADSILTVSINTENDLIKMLGCDPQKITVTQLGVDDRFYNCLPDSELQVIKQKYGLPDAYTLFIGLVEPRKNVPLLIRAYLNLLEQEAITQDLVIGGRWGWESKQILDELEQHPQRSKIHFIGYFDEADKPAIYQLADIFVYPTAYEGFGLPVLEAMASATPVITTHVSSIPEIIGDQGLLIQPDDQEALENAMKTMLNSSSLRDEFLANARLRSREFSWKSMVDRTLQAYEDTLRKGKQD
jgi:glycosyltransferase involved in cell wall biosynthesis